LNVSLCDTLLFSVLTIFGFNLKKYTQSLRKQRRRNARNVIIIFDRNTCINLSLPLPLIIIILYYYYRLFQLMPCPIILLSFIIIAKEKNFKTKTHIYCCPSNTLIVCSSLFCNETCLDIGRLVGKFIFGTNWSVNIRVSLFW